MAITEIWRIDDNGEMKHLATYLLPSERALICFKEQEKGNMNTWDYPSCDPEIKQTPHGEFAYFSGKNTSTYTRSIKK